MSIPKSVKLVMSLQQQVIDFFNEVGDVVITGSNVDPNSFNGVRILPGEPEDMYRLAEASKMFTGNTVMGTIEGQEYPSRESFDKTEKIIRTFFDDLGDRMVNVAGMTYMEYFMLVCNEFNVFLKK